MAAFEFSPEAHRVAELDNRLRVVTAQLAELQHEVAALPSGSGAWQIAQRAMSRLEGTLAVLRAGRELWADAPIELHAPGTRDPARPQLQ